MERLTIGELIEHCDRKMDWLPSGNILYQEHKSVRGYLQILRHYIAAGLMPERAAELAQAERDGRLVVLPEGVTVRRLYEEYRKAKHMADERLPSPDHTTGRIAGFGAGVVYILGKILACEETEAALEKEEHP